MEIIKNTTITKQNYDKNRSKVLENISAILETPAQYLNKLYDHYDEMFTSNNTYMILCSYESEAVAYAFVRFYPETQKYYIMDVNTAKKYQNQHIATNLIKYLLTDFFNKNNDNIYLWVHKDNVIAKKIYTRFGFKLTDEKPYQLDFFNNIKDDDFYVCTKNAFKLKKMNFNKQKHVKN